MSSKTSYIFIAPGFEEMEAIATVDAMRRAHIKVTVVSVSDSLLIKGASGQTMVGDILISQADTSEADWIVIPGGDPGAWNLIANEEVKKKILAHHDKGGHFAAICAGAPIVLAPLGIIKGKKATCYPFMADLISKYGGHYEDSPVVVEPGLITSQAPGTALLFAIEIIRATKGDKMADGIAAAMLIGR